MKSIIYNLLSNAIKYKAIDRDPKLAIFTREIDGYVVLSVKDNGLGIDSDDYKKIFKLFKRLHTHVEGTGIGLYIVKKIVNDAGGNIEVESESGVGSTFNVYFKK